LELSNQEISSDQLETYWAEIVSLEPKITRLDLQDNQIEYIDFMSDLSKVTTLNLSNNKIEDLDANSLSGFNNLERLDFSNNNFIFFNSYYLSPETKDSIKVLNLNNNAL
jgi:Leucine-rich repeat (LRR) protein